MATIDRLSIQGVRSFSPDSSAQVIEFLTPCTVIVGMNGCGKTTIVECLKYAITGGLPPGSTPGHAFVHDPRTQGQSTVKAKLKLQITTRADEFALVIRNMELTRKKTTFSFKQLEGALYMQDKDTQERRGGSCKGTELDELVPELLGISKAILDNVLFCHQEDACWPLMEGGAPLKKRFDAIFDTTRYRMALEEFRSSEKELQGDLKTIDLNLATLKVHKEAAAEARKELALEQEQMEDLENYKDDMLKMILDIDVDLQHYGAIGRKVEAQRGKIDEIAKRVNSLQVSIESKLSVIEQDLTETHSLQDLNERLAQLTSSELGYRLGERCTKLREIAKKHDYSLDLSLVHHTKAGDVWMPQETDSTNFSNEDQEDLSLVLCEKEEELLAVVQQLCEQAQLDCNDRSQIVNRLSLEKAAKEAYYQKLTERKNEILSELDIALQLLEKRALKPGERREIDGLKQHIAQLSRDLATASSSERKVQIPAEIKSLQSAIEKIHSKIAVAQEALRTCRENAVSQDCLQSLQRQVEADLQSLNESIRNNADGLTRFGVQSFHALSLNADGDVVEAVETIVKPIMHKFQQVTQQLTTTSDVVLNLEKEWSGKSALLESSRQSLASLKSEQKEILVGEDLLSEVRRLIVCIRDADPSLTGIDEHAPDAMLEYLDRKLNEVAGQAPLSFAPTLCERLCQQIVLSMKTQTSSTGDLACPCCQQQMIALGEFETRLLNLLSSNYALLQCNAESMAAYQSKMAQLLEWKTTVAKFVAIMADRLRLSKDIATAEVKTEELHSATMNCEAALGQQKQLVAEIAWEEKQLQALVNVSRRWTQDASRIAKIQHSVVMMSSNCSFSDGRDNRAVERDVSNGMQEKEALLNTLNNLNSEMADLNQSIADLSSQKSDAEVRSRELDARCAEAKSAEDRVNELKSEQLNLDREEDELRIEIDAMAKEITLKEEERSSLQKSVGEFKQDINDIDPELESVRGVAKERERTAAKLLENNIKLLNEKFLQASLLETMSFEQAVLMEIEGGATAHDMYDEKMAEKNALDRKKAQLEGQCSEITERIRTLKRKLSRPEYKEVDKQYKIAMVKKETTEVAVEDLQKYQAALDQSLLQFHEKKIAEVNRIIHELWLLTYKGDDISNIRIVSGHEGGLNATKSYNYRVVMTKHVTELDMRGRCSAGQRVLASIVIRLALAETFGVNFGCIVLDEPTVNLDYTNKKGLAIALAQIVASRARQRNFQLILITHDEEFVWMMKTELSSQGVTMPEDFFRVSRVQAPDGRYNSMINPVDWEELEFD